MSLRDAPGGTGQFLNGTDSIQDLRIDFLGVRDITTGAYSYEVEAPGSDTVIPLITYCAQPAALITFGDYPEDTVGLGYYCESTDALAGFTASELSFLEILWFNAFDDSITSSIKAAAFQSIIWELALDDVFDLTSGEFYIGASSAAVLTQAQEYAAKVQNQTWTQAQPLAALTHPISQDVLIPTILIPEPGALSLMFIAGGALLSRRR